MELKDRIKAARKHAHLSQVQLAQAVGMTQTSISDLERGKSRATSFVARIAGACGVNPLWLAEGRGEMLAERGQANAGPNASWLGAVESWDDETPLDADEIELPFYKEIELSGGKGSTVILQTGGRKLRFGKYTLRKKNIDPASAACVTVSGNSMEPVLPDGSTVGVDTSARTIKDGDMYAFDHDGQLRVKLLYRLPGGGLRIRSFNSDEHPDERYEPQEAAEHINVIGRVFWYSVLV
ncbi:TPA: transcriptional regulator AlpR [Pseudomonas aeruginosa]|nr:transcriptional regulator AlpR [Pseudomonas aeruginosa]HEJ3332414.1 transcriptional regulator AlpR [Pseudomonas aeruginosa]HEJ5003692.1 transcriptional regulator AlpR [Pseudomonas aeruginosa]HEJ5060091.1 transcriptional regulator AlpR [Pseudomonas aeruginosa]